MWRNKSTPHTVKVLQEVPDVEKRYLRKAASTWTVNVVPVWGTLREDMNPEIAATSRNATTNGTKSLVLEISCYHTYPRMNYLDHGLKLCVRGSIGVISGPYQRAVRLLQILNHGPCSPKQE